MDIAPRGVAVVADEPSAARRGRLHDVRVLPCGPMSPCIDAAPRDSHGRGPRKRCKQGPVDGTLIAITSSVLRSLWGGSSSERVAVRLWPKRSRAASPDRQNHVDAAGVLRLPSTGSLHRKPARCRSPEVTLPSRTLRPAIKPVGRMTSGKLRADHRGRAGCRRWGRAGARARRRRCPPRPVREGG